MSQKPPETSEDFRSGRSPMRIAADLRWADPNRKWETIAEEVGVTVRQLWNWRQTEEWRETWRQAGIEIDAEYMLPLANEALKAAWRKGNPALALELKRAHGILSNERIEVTTMTAAEVIELQKRLESTSD